MKMLPNDRITPLFQATAQATEAAITNALLAAETTTGANDLRIYAMPVDRMLGGHEEVRAVAVVCARTLPAIDTALIRDWDRPESPNDVPNV